MSITSLLVILNFSDLGLSLGLVSALARADGLENRDAARRYVASSVWMLSVSGAVLILVAAVSYVLVPWARLFNVSSPIATREAGTAAVTFIIVGALSLPLGVMGRIQQGFQEGFVANAYQCVGSILSLVFLLSAIRLNVGLPWLILAVTGAPIVAAIINVSISGVRRYRWLSIGWSYVTPSVVRALYRTGAAIFALQLGYAAAYNSDNILIAQILGPVSVAQYSVCVRLFSISTVAVALVTSPLWSAYAEAQARGDSAWLANVVRRVVKVGLIAATLPALLFILFGQQIVAAWAGAAMRPDLSLLIALAVWVILDSVRITSMTFLSATGRFRFQILLFLVFAPVSVASRVLGARAAGLSGMVWANVACLVALVLAYVYYTSRILRPRRPIKGVEGNLAHAAAAEVDPAWQ